MKLLLLSTLTFCFISFGTAQSLFNPETQESKDFSSELAAVENVEQEEIDETELEESTIDFIDDRPIDIPNYIEDTEENDNFSMSLWVPGFLFDAAALFVPKEEEPELKALLKEVGNIYIMIRTGEEYDKSLDKKYKKIAKKMKRQNYEPLVSVVSADADVEIQVKTDDKNRIRKTVVLVNTEDTFVYVNVSGKIDINDLIKMIEDQENIDLDLGDNIF